MEFQNANLLLANTLRKTLIPMTAVRSSKLSDKNEICLIAILATDDGEPASMQKSYPRAKVSVMFAD